jgi:hypothetical protein
MHVDFKDVTIPQVLTLLGNACGVEVRVEGVLGIEAARTVPSVRFDKATLPDMFLFLAKAARLGYAVVDDKTILITSQ